MWRPWTPHRRRNSFSGRQRYTSRKPNITFTARWREPPIANSALADERQQHLEALAAHHRQLQQWAANCPENFENRAMLVGAEIGRLEGRDREAMDLYEQAIRSAQANGFVHNEALANELAARFYAARGFERFAHVCLQDARYGYVRWGANGKVRQLDQLYPQFREAEPVSRPTGTIGTPVEHLDLATVLRVSQAVSGEIVLEKLLDTLMRRAIEHAGAQRGLLIVPRGTEQRIAAEATISGDTVSVHLSDKSVTAAALPELILHYVVRTREAVLLDDAAAENPFAADPYHHQHQARSILCLPLINQSKLIGVLYLENDLAPHVFTPARLAVLKLLASQAAISLENTRLYRDVVEREAKIRRLVDANIIGIYIWDFQGRIIDANEAFLDMVGYSREDLISGCLYYSGLTPSEWNDVSERARAVVKTTGTAKVFEKEYLRKDGSRVPILLGGATFGEGQDQGVAFVLDLTERKRAEAAARGMQLELAHANRVATMGQLTASIAHVYGVFSSACRVRAGVAAGGCVFCPVRRGDVELRGGRDRDGACVRRVSLWDLARAEAGRGAGDHPAGLVHDGLCELDCCVAADIERAGRWRFLAGGGRAGGCGGYGDDGVGYGDGPGDGSVGRVGVGARGRVFRRAGTEFRGLGGDDGDGLRVGGGGDAAGKPGRCGGFGRARVRGATGRCLWVGCSG